MPRAHEAPGFNRRDDFLRLERGERIDIALTGRYWDRQIMKDATGKSRLASPSEVAAKKSMLERLIEVVPVDEDELVRKFLRAGKSTWDAIADRSAENKTVLDRLWTLKFGEKGYILTTEETLSPKQLKTVLRTDKLELPRFVEGAELFLLEDPEITETDDDATTETGDDKIPF